MPESYVSLGHAPFFARSFCARLLEARFTYAIDTKLVTFKPDIFVYKCHSV